jgi:elongation factor Ts
MEITTALIKELRERTGAGILDCKAALTETNGDTGEAEKNLRKKGLAAAAKKAGRVAAEGLVGYVVADGTAALVELNCETDFVAKTPDFGAARKALAELILATAGLGEEGSLDALLALTAPAALPGAEGTVAEWLQAFTAKTGENTQIRRYARLVAVDGSRLTLSPQFASRDSVSAKALADEREIARAKAIAAGKPEAVVEKMVEGMISKWFGEVVLVDQPFAKDDSKKVSQVIAERAGKDGRVVRFVRYKVGEGIEKKQSDFAAEVAAMTK